MLCILCTQWLALYLWRFIGEKINYNYNCTAYCCGGSTFSLQQQHAHRWTPANKLTPSPSQLELIPTGDPPHGTQFPVLTAVPQFGCSGTGSLLQRARFTVRYIPQERLHISPGIHALNKEDTKEAIRNRRGRSEAAQLIQQTNWVFTELQFWPRSVGRITAKQWQTCTAFRQQCEWWMHRTARRYSCSCLS